MLEHLISSPSYPTISIGELLAAAQSAGARLRAGRADFNELHDIPKPFLFALENSNRPEEGCRMLLVARMMQDELIIDDGRFSTSSLSISSLRESGSPIVLWVEDTSTIASPPTEIDQYRMKVEVIDDFLSSELCKELIFYAEAVGFELSRVMQREGDSSTSVISTSARSSYSVVLHDRQHPALRELYVRCAALEGVQVDDIETIQCVRYAHGQNFQPHFDGGINLPRSMTYLLYLNDDFVGGETYFSMLDYMVLPRAGSCLRFPSCDTLGNIIWPSEHGGCPVISGRKYVLNIWIRRSTGTPTVPHNRI